MSSAGSGDPDEALLDRWQAGEPAAGGILVKRHYGRVYRFFANKLPAEADDLTQRTFADLHRAIERVRSASSLRVYLMAIARNNLYMSLRSRMSRARTFDPDVDSAGEGVDDRTPSRLLADRAEERLLLRALRRIPVAGQIVLELYYWESMSTKEIAEVLDVAPGTVMSRLTRARDRLRRTIEQLEADPQTIASTLAGLDTWADGIRRRVDGE